LCERNDVVLVIEKINKKKFIYFKEILARVKSISKNKRRTIKKASHI
jgi:hypothetical protein